MIFCHGKCGYVLQNGLRKMCEPPLLGAKGKSLDPFLVNRSLNILFVKAWEGLTKEQ
jgi:hypothetical protein